MSSENNITLLSSSSACKEISRIIFIGSGTSMGTPVLGCLMKFPMDCEGCMDAIKSGSKNRRRNPSILIQYKMKKNILIDCGKTFREAIIACIIQYQVRHIDAVILTHDHADAILGLDDLREFTEGRAIPVFIRDRDLPSVARMFPYLFDVNKATGSGYVSKIEFISFSEMNAFQVEGLEFLPLPVNHGPDYTSTAFLFGDVLYMSDVSGIPPATRNVLNDYLFKKSGTGDFVESKSKSSNEISNGFSVKSMRDNNRRLELFIVDGMPNGHNISSHWNMEDALKEVRQWRPKETRFTGVSHLMLYEPTNLTLRKLWHEEQLNVQLAYDGLCIDVHL